MFSSWYALVLVVPSFGGHHAKLNDCCDVCGVETAFVATEMNVLAASPKRHDRERAAHDLRKVSWKCHPEAVAALCAALLNDCDDDVREEAAQSLTRMAPCLPEAHVALARAASCDPDHSTRHWARKALARVNHHCVGDCVLCEPLPAQVVAPMPQGAPKLLPAPEGEPMLLPADPPSPPAPEGPLDDRVPPPSNRASRRPPLNAQPPADGPVLEGPMGVRSRNSGVAQARVIERDRRSGRLISRPIGRLLRRLPAGQRAMDRDKADTSGEKLAREGF